MEFRNVEGSTADPVIAWHPEGLLEVCERGLIQDWRPIIAELKNDPHGKFSRLVLTTADLVEDPHMASLMRIWVTGARRTPEERFAMKFREWVSRSGLSRAEIAKRLGTSRSRLSTYETGAVTPSAVIAMKMEALVPPVPL